MDSKFFQFNLTFVLALLMLVLWVAVLKRLATLAGCNPSTSFEGSTALNILASLMLGGSGSWISIPCTFGSAFHVWMVSRSVSSVMSDTSLNS